MGLIRFILAIAVVIGHSSPLFGLLPLYGKEAVQLFYSISGFYMALVLSSKYNTGSPRVFYFNRILRIYPTYLIILIATIFLNLSLNATFYYKAQELYQSFRLMNVPTIIILAVTNLFIVGQDWLIPTAISEVGGGLYFAPHFREELLPTQRFFLLPQSWSIGLEVVFYFMAPYLAKLQLKYLIFITLMIMGAKLIFAVNFGLNYDPWTYRFFPFELATFLLGMISYKIYKLKIHWINSFSYKKTMLTILVLCLIAYRYVFQENSTYSYLLMIGFNCLLPFIFSLSKDSRWDSQIGQMSYPIYLVHFFWIQLLNYFHVMNGFYVLILSIGSAFLIEKLTHKIESSFKIRV